MITPLPAPSRRLAQTGATIALQVFCPKVWPDRYAPEAVAVLDAVIYAAEVIESRRSVSGQRAQISEKAIASMAEAIAQHIHDRPYQSRWQKRPPSPAPIIGAEFFEAMGWDNVNSVRQAYRGLMPSIAGVALENAVAIGMECRSPKHRARSQSTVERCADAGAILARLESHPDFEWSGAQRSWWDICSLIAEDILNRPVTQGRVEELTGFSNGAWVQTRRKTV